MAVEQKNALGAFPNLQQLESALDRLKAAGFPAEGISTIVEHVEPAATEELAGLTDSLSEPGAKFTLDRRRDRIQQRAAGGGAVGGVVGTALAGIATLTFPVGGGALLLAGTLGGAFYGAVAGGIVGGSIGINITDAQAQHYSDLLARGYYLVAIKGSAAEIATAESVLTEAGVEDWMMFKSV